MSSRNDMAPVELPPERPEAVPPKRTYVLAGTHVEYHQYLREQHLTAKQAIYLRATHQLEGIENPEIVRVGTWAGLRNLGQIEAMIAQRTRPA